MMATKTQDVIHANERRHDSGNARPCASPQWALLICISLILSGCATSQLHRAEQLGTLGKTYAEAVNLAGQEAMASSIGFSLSEIQKERAGNAFQTPQDRAKALKDEIDVLKERQQMIETSNHLVALLAEYFSNLEQFAIKDVSGSFETTTGGLVDSFNNVNKALEKNPEAHAKISDAERGSLAKLSGLVARQVHGQALARVLERDAPMIGAQLNLLSKILATYSNWIRSRNDIELMEFYHERIEKPFVGPGELSDGWGQDVRRYLQGASLSEQLTRAKAAGDKTERFWADYLAGKMSISDVITDLKDIEGVLKAISDFGKAKAEASPAKSD
jgi:hypothetical protein